MRGNHTPHQARKVITWIIKSGSNFKKTIDISFAVCYTYIKIRKGEKIMKNIIYMSTLTGECTENHKDAVALFNEGHDIDIMDWSETLGEWICRMTWEH